MRRCRSLPAGENKTGMPPCYGIFWVCTTIGPMACSTTRGRTSLDRIRTERPKCPRFIHAASKGRCELNGRGRSLFDHNGPETITRLPICWGHAEHQCIHFPGTSAIGCRPDQAAGRHPSVAVLRLHGRDCEDDRSARVDKEPERLTMMTAWADVREEWGSGETLARDKAAEILKLRVRVFDETREAAAINDLAITQAGSELDSACFKTPGCAFDVPLPQNP